MADETYQTFYMHIVWPTKCWQASIQLSNAGWWEWQEFHLSQKHKRPFCTFLAKIFYLIFPKNCNFEVNIREYCKLWEFYSLVLTHLLWPASLDISCNRTLHDEGYYNISSSGSTRPRCKLLLVIFYISSLKYILKGKREGVSVIWMEFSGKEGKKVVIIDVTLKHLVLALLIKCQSW